MKRYAQIVDEELGSVIVGTGTNYDYYESIGMEEMEVEQAYNGAWYVMGYAPEKPQSVINEERIAELKANIAATDAVVLEMAENAMLNGGNLVMPLTDDTDYSTILSNRAAWRAELKTLTSNL